MKDLYFFISKLFLASKDTIRSETNNSQNEEEFTNDISEKGLVSSIYKEHLQFNNKKTKSPINAWDINMNSHLRNADKTTMR